MTRELAALLLAHAARGAALLAPLAAAALLAAS